MCQVTDEVFWKDVFFQVELRLSGVEYTEKVKIGWKSAQLLIKRESFQRNTWKMSLSRHLTKDIRDDQITPYLTRMWQVKMAGDKFHLSHSDLTWMSLMSLISRACCSSQPLPHSPRLLLFSRWRWKKWESRDMMWWYMTGCSMCDMMWYWWYMTGCYIWGMMWWYMTDTLGNLS